MPRQAPPIAFAPDVKEHDRLRIFELIAQTHPDLLQVVDASGRIVFMNDAVRQVRVRAGLSPQNLQVAVLVHPDEQHDAAQELKALFQGDKVRAEGVFRLRQSDGEYRAYRVVGQRMSVDSDLGVLVLLTYVDIQDQLQLEHERHEKAALFDALVSAISEITSLLDPSGRPVYLSPALRQARQAQGVDAEAPLGALIHPDDREQVLLAFKEVATTGNPGVAQYRYLDATRENEWRTVRSQARAVFDERGQIKYVLNATVDLTDQLEQENKLRQAEIKAARFDSEQRLGALLNQGVLGIMELDADGVIVEVNDAVCRMGGFTREQALGRHLEEFVDPPERVNLRTRIEALARGEEPEAIQLRKYRHQNGQPIWVAAQVRAIRDPQGRVTGSIRFAIDITPQKLAEEALAESEAKYRLITDHQTDFVQLWNTDGTLVYDSPSLLRLRHEDHFKVRGAGDPATTLIHPDDRERLREVFQSLTTGGQARYEARWILPSGEMRWVEGTGRAILGPDGQVEKVLTVNRDITDRKLAEQQREQALEQARIASEAKSQFLARVSHELRTPLNAVLGYGYLLSQSALDATQAAQLQQIVSSSKHLLGLISDVLDLSRIEAGQQRVNPAPFSLKVLLNNVLDAVRPAADARGIALLGEDTRDLPDQWIADEGLIRQALLNFLSNAVKFTERGQVRLLVRAPIVGGQRLRFEVHDTGPGIAPDKLGALFQAFSQLAQDARGTGLGLEITRRIVEAMGGEVGVQSTPGQGSCFWFELELELQPGPTQALAQQPGSAEPMPQPASVPAAAESLRARHAGTTVMVAEDDPISQALMTILLEEVGLNAELANDGAEALALAEAGQYALVLMDRQMPGMDGLEATRAIRRLPGWQQAPIVALTADALTETRDACLAAGMTSFLTKPVDADQLYSALLELLDRA